MLSEKVNNLRDNPLIRAALLQEQSLPSATLYIVGLPIGNAADITLRAIWVLSACDTIACEDTRETRKLLDRYAIFTQCVSVHEHNECEGAEKLIERLRQGERVALVTDAGTPAVSDPGSRVVQAVRSAGFRIVPVPGASAVVSAVSAAGLDAYRFTFAGFAESSGKAREESVVRLCEKGEAFVLYEAPHRVRDLLKIFGKTLEANRRVVVARELTKRFETFCVLQAGELLAWSASHEPRGEYVVLVDERGSHDKERLDESVLRWARAIATELPISRTAAIAAKVSGVKRETIYRTLLEEQDCRRNE